MKLNLIPDYIYDSSLLSQGYIHCVLLVFKNSCIWDSFIYIIILSLASDTGEHLSSGSGESDHAFMCLK